MSTCFLGIKYSGDLVSCFCKYSRYLRLTVTIAGSTDENERWRNTKSAQERYPTNRNPRPQVPQQHWLLEPNRPKITEDDIASGIVLASNTARKVLRISENMVAKFGPDVDLTEAHAISFIRDHSEIPVPKILNAYSQDGKNYIVMEYIEGDLLKDVSYTMAEEELAVIVEELRSYISSMRRLRAPEGVLIGSVTQGPAIDRRQFGPASGGPFQSERDFNEWQLAQLRPGVALASREMYADMHKNSNQILFSHGDLAFHNIIVKDGHVKAIIDWEYAGWYPEYWDYCKTRSFLGGTDSDYLVCKRLYEKPYHPEYFLYIWFGMEILHGGF